jgi:hypothetical protein
MQSLMPFKGSALFGASLSYNQMGSLSSNSRNTSASNLSMQPSQTFTRKGVKFKGVKEDDWSNVTDPGERKKIQTRNAQRKFREKAKREKAKAEANNNNKKTTQESATEAQKLRSDVATTGPAKTERFNPFLQNPLPWMSTSWKK